MEARPASPDTSAESKAAAPRAAAGYYPPPGNTGGKVIVNRDIEIFPDRQRPELASFQTWAYEAQKSGASNRHLALLCGRSRGPRITSIASYRNIKNPHLLRLEDAGIVHWAPEGRQLFALVFDMPPEKKLMGLGDPRPHPMSEDRVISLIIQPILSVLADFRAADMVHGAISSDNIFMTRIEGVETAMLGECLTSAPGFRQHPFFETIERAMAQPSGRGPGSVKNDLYSLGMCAALALKKQNPLLDKTSQQIIRAKIEDGSYSFAVSGERLPHGMGEFLKGVLNDDEGERWDLDTALRWLDDRRLGGKPSTMVVSAARPFVFKEEKFWNLPSLAMAFADNVGEAAQELENDAFSLWVKRNFEDKQLEDRLIEVWRKEEGAGPEKRVADLCLALDPEAPVRYKNLSILPSGFGTALADAAARGEDVQAYAEMIAMQYLNLWTQQKFQDLPDATGMITLFEKCRNFLMQRMAGYGLERVVYLLNNEAVCLSPALKNYFVLSPGHLLLALEGLSRQSGRPDSILDRHMTAFVSVREPKMIDPHLGHIISRDRGHQMTGIVKTLAAIQRRFRTGSVPGLGNWIISLIAPAIDNYKDRDLRQEVARRMNKLVDTGNLAAILELIDTPALVRDDANRFALSRREYMMLNQERETIQMHLKNRKTFGLPTGRQTAMLLSSALSFCAIISFVVFYFIGF